MRDHSRDAYSAFAEDRRKLSAPRSAYSPTLRLKALAFAVLAGLLIWGMVIYILTR